MSVERRFSLIRHEHSEYLTTASAASTYLPLSGGSLTGAISLNVSGSHITLYDTNGADTADRGLVELNGSLIGLLTFDSSATKWNYAFQSDVVSGAVHIGATSNTNCEVYLYGTGAPVASFVSGNATTGYCRLLVNGGSVLRGYLYGDASGFGLLTSAGGWGVQCSPSHILLNNPLQLGVQTTATTATAGARTLPANPVDFLVVVINGTSRKIPYYAT